MPSPKIIELEQILQTYSIEDKQWLLQQLIQQLGLDNQEKPPVNYKQQAKGIIAETHIPHPPVSQSVISDF
jgi:hypothetical protein